MTVASFPTTPAGLDDFKQKYAAGVAKYLNISSSAVSITSVTLATRRDRRRTLLASSVSVVYVVTLAASQSAGQTAATISTSLSSPSNQAALSQSLVNSGLVGAETAAPTITVTNISPTSTPTSLPSSQRASSSSSRRMISIPLIAQITLTTMVTLLIINRQS